MGVTPASKLEGPIPATADSTPFIGVGTQPIPGPGLPPLPLASAGYVQEEYFVSGSTRAAPTGRRSSFDGRRIRLPSAGS